MKNAFSPHPLAILLLAGLLTALPGCEVFSFIAALGGESVKAKYKLADRATLVMVDDPDNHLGRSSLTGLMAQTLGKKLRKEKVLTEETRLVSPYELRDLEHRLGDDYSTTPIVQVGRLLDAEQVIHVRVQNVDLTRAPGVYEPKMTVEVKVLDAVESKRLFPRSLELDDQWNDRGHVLETKTPLRTPESMDSGVRASLMRDLVIHTGTRASQLFYKHKKPEPGSTLN